MSQQITRLIDNPVFRKRTITTIIALPLVAVIIWLGSPWFTILGVVWGIGGANEFYSIIKRSRGIKPLTYFGLLWVILAIISPHFGAIPHLNGISPVALLLTTAIIFPLVMLLWRSDKENAFANWAWTIAGILYVGWLLSYFIALRNVEDGRGWVYLAMLSTFASDIGAYLIGRLLGKHKMAPYISPNKTWEGAVAGVAGSILICTMIAFLFHLPINYWQAILLGALISIVGQLGDLVKSLFKRNMTVKDSGNVLPGHGGFLDRMDSIAFTGVAVYYFVAFFIPI